MRPRLFGTRSSRWSAPRPKGPAGGGSASPAEIAGIAVLVALAVWRLGSAAWHGASRRIGAAGAAALGLAFLVGVLALSGTWARNRRPREAPRPRRGALATAATWASPQDLRPLRVAGPEGGRLVLGRSGRHLLAVEHHQSVIVIGPTQSQKTSGVAVPAILEWPGPVVATSVKTDLVRDTIDWRRQVGRVLVYDPAAATGLPTPARWSPLTTAGSWQGARRTAGALCSVTRSSGRGGMEDAGFWYAMAEKLLAPLLFAAATAGASMADVCRWVDTGEMREVQLALELAGVPEALRAAEASFARDERQRSSVYATVESVLEAFADPSVLASAETFVGDEQVVRPDALLDGGAGTLYVCAPAHEQERLQPVFVAVLRQVLETALERAAAGGRPLDPPLLVVLDEAANVAPVADLDRLASTAAGHGVQLVTVFQDMAQIEARYGARAGTVVNNHRAKLLLSGISDPATLEHVSRLAGEEELLTPATTVDADGRTSRTHSATTRALAPAAWLRRIEPGSGVLIYGHLPPARIGLRPWFADADLRARARPGGGE